MRCLVICYAVSLGVFVAEVASGQAPVFSGPQVGETIGNFEMKLVLGEATGKQVDPVEMAAGKPLLLVFVHKFNEPTIVLARTLANYAMSRQEAKPTSAVVWLSDDPSSLQTRLNKAHRVWSENTVVGMFTGGGEGPGSYGLNRNVQMTILIADKNKVIANFALVQPSFQADAVTILATLAQVIGEKPPTLDELLAPGRANRRARTELQKVLALAAFEGLDRAALRLEETVADEPLLRQQLGQISRRIVERGIYNTSSRAHRYLDKWARQSAAPQDGKE